MIQINAFRKRSVWAALFFGGGLVLATGCKKPEDSLGLSVQPAEDQLSLTVVDTSTITGHTVDEDSIRTNSLTYNLLGSYTDPEFGFVSASTITQVRLAAFLDSGDVDLNNLAVDSVVLAMKYTGDYYGTLDLQRFRVYEVTEDLFTDTSYYSNSPIMTSTSDMIAAGNQIQVPDPVSDVIVGGDTLLAQLRLRLDNTWGETVLNQSANGTLNNQDLWLNYFKGIQVFADNNIPPSEYGGIFTFDMDDGNSKITIYYRNTEVGNEDTLAYDLVINENAARWTKFDLDHTGTVVGDQLAGDTAAGQMTLFAQSMGGVKSLIRFPHLMDYVDSGMVSLNKAELVLPVNNTLTRGYLPHERLIVFVAPENLDGSGTFPIDFFEGDSHFDGFWEPSANEYRINVTRHLQRILTGAEPNTGFYVIPVSSGITANRTVLHGPADSTKNLKLELFYTNY